MIVSPTTLVPKQTLQYSQLVVPIPQPSATQPLALATLREMPTTSFEIIADFREEDVVYLDDYYLSKTEKAVVKRGSKRTKQGTIV